MRVAGYVILLWVACLVLVGLAHGATLPIPKLPPAAAAPNVPFLETGRDLPPVIPSACQTQPMGNPFLLPWLSVDAISGDGTNIGIGSNHGCITPQNEPAIAVNPTNPQNVVIGSNDYRLCCDSAMHNDGGGIAYSSFDGGKTFEQVISPGWTTISGGRGFFGAVDSAGDPSLAYGPHGTLYYANMAFSRSSNLNGLAVSVSKDGGRSFSRPHLVAALNDPRYFIDKPWVTVGPGGMIYVSFTLFVSDDSGHYVASPIFLAESRDSVHWKYYLVSGGWFYNQGSTPQVSPTGKLFVSFEGYDVSTGQDEILVVSAAAHTLTVVASVHDNPACYFVNGDGRETLTGETFRSNNFPAFSIDPVTGRQVLAWADNVSCSKPTRSEILTSFGNASGTHYSAPYQLPGEGDRSFPAVAAFNGSVAVSYYTRGYATDGKSLDYALQYPLVGQQEFRLTEQSSDPSLQFDGAFIGDYTGLVLGTDGVAHAAWTDFRGLPGVTAPNQDIYTAAVR